MAEQSSNVEVMRRWYGGPQPEVLSDDCEWFIMEGFPHGGRWAGRDAIFGKFFPQMMSHFNSWNVKLDELIDGGEYVIGLGRYEGSVKTTGLAFAIPFAHVWKLRDGKIVQLRQFTDTNLLKQALR